MVVKIQPPCASLSPVLEYNDRKVDSGTCETVAVWNAGTSDPDEAYRVMQDYARGSRRTRDVVFHVSVNPSSADRMDREKILRFIRDMMGRLGYGKQPMVIFEHRDTDRIHWHVVSVRVDSDGYKISDRYENRRCHDIITELSRVYGFKVGRSEDVPRNSAEYDLSHDLASRIEKALRYRFTSMPQLFMVMQSLGVKVYESPSKELSFRLLDRSGKVCSPAIDAMDLMIPSRDDMEKTVASQKWSNDDTFRRRQRVNGCVKAALSNAPTGDDFRRMLAAKGIDVVYSRTDEERVFGVTFIDHTTRSAFKGSELEKGLSASTFNDLMQGRWKTDGNGIGEPAPTVASTTVSNHRTFSENVGAEVAAMLMESLMESKRRNETPEGTKRKKRKRRM
ncbi:MAG: relaxase/mobilization nuclease domain-containing protein [Candidatus Cryptobacteroides sp.]